MSGEEIPKPVYVDPRCIQEALRMYFQPTKNDDTGCTNRYNEDLNTILIFAGLVSAVSSVFVIDVRLGFQPYPGQLSEAYLRAILLNPNHIIFPGEDPTASPTCASIPQETTATSGFLYSSLVMSFLAAFIVVLGKQWLNKHLRRTAGPKIEGRGHRQRNFDDLEKFPFRFFIESPPIMLQVALLLLICHFSPYEWSANTSTVRVILSFTVLGFLFYIGIVVAGTSYEDGTFQTPGSISLRHFWDSRTAPKTLASLPSQAEERRERIFHENEEARERVFDEAELRRAEEAAHKRNQIWADLEDRLRALLPVTTAAVSPTKAGSTLPAPAYETPVHTAPVTPVPVSPALPAMDSVPLPGPVPIHEGGAPVAESMQAAAARRAEEIRDTVELEREQMATERAEVAAERERMMEELREERARLVAELQTALAMVKADLEIAKVDLRAERALRISDETDRRERERMEDLERHEGLYAQLNDITNLVQEQRDECFRVKESTDERWNEKMNRRVEKDAQIGNLYDMVVRIIDDRETERIRMEEEKIVAESRPGSERVIDELARQNAEQRELLDQMADSWRNDMARNREETLATIRETANEQTPYNVQGYLDEFVKSLANEVRMLLGEVGQLREEKGKAQSKLDILRARHRSDREFDPTQRPDPTQYHDYWSTGRRSPRPPGDQTPPPPPETPPSPSPKRSHSAWRILQQRPGKGKAKKPAPGPEPRPPPPSWAIWEPDTRYVPTPPAREPSLLVPPRGSPGLFGPRSPPDSLQL